MAAQRSAESWPFGASKPFVTPDFYRIKLRPKPFSYYVKAIDDDGNMNWFWFVWGLFLEASEPRGYVYSHFGMILDLAQTGLEVDYTKSVEDVYTDFAEAIANVGQAGHFSHPSERYPSLPSWVPDWF